MADHSETYTFHYYYRRKGLRNVRFYAGFPDHSVRVITSLIDLGFSNKKAVPVRKDQISPPEFLTQLLRRHKSPKSYQERENLWVEVTGREQRRRKTILMECVVPTINGWEEAGCNIDTGFPASIMAQMLKEDVITKRGSFAPEAVVPEKEFFKALGKRKMAVFEDGRKIN
jgi:lysine 6-dehydrogenase